MSYTICILVVEVSTLKEELRTDLEQLQDGNKLGSADTTTEVLFSRANSTLDFILITAPLHCSK